MRKTKKLLSLLTAVTMAASAFSAIVVPASAADGDNIVLKATNAGVINANSGYSTYDGSSSIALNGATNSSSAWGSDGIVEFSVPTIPDGYKINTATLDVYVESDIQNRASYRALGAIGLDTKATINGFSSTVPTTTGTTYDAQDIYLSANASYTDGTKAGSWDVSDYVKAQMDAEDSFIQFYLDAQFTTNATSAHGWTVYGYNTSYPPTLTITLVSTDTATYTVTTNYVDESNNTVAASVVAEDVTEGTLYTPTYETEFNKDGYKYTYKSGGDAVTVTGDTTITVVYSSRALAETTYTVTGVLGEATKTLATDTITEDSTVTVGYPKYVIGDDGVLYSVAAQSVGSNYHSVAITGTQENQTVTVTYSAETATPVYYAEMEDVLTNNNVSNAALRCSNGAGGNLDDSQTIATLSAGTYVVTTAVWGGSNKGDSYNSTYVLTAGDTTAASATTTGSLVTVTGDEFTLTEDTDLVLTKTVTGSSSACIDYILITGTGTATSDDDDDEPTDPDEPTSSTEPTATGTPIPAEEATGTPIPEEEATGTPIPEEEATPIPAGTVLYSEDYENATAVDWTTSTSGRFDPMLKTDGTNTWVGVDMSTRYNNGAQIKSPDYSSYVSGLTEYAIEFDAALGYNDANQTPWFEVATSDGYLLYLYGAGTTDDGGANWTINGTTDTLAFATSGYVSDVSSADVASTSTWYHYRLLCKDGLGALEVTDTEGNAIYDLSLIVPSGTACDLTQIIFGTQRYSANFEIDNIVIRTLEEDEFPEVTQYSVYVNTTRYATMELADGTVYYADVDGKISIPLVDNGTTYEYTLKKVGYTSVTGTATVDGADLTIDAPLTLDEAHADYIYIESDFGNADGAYVSASGTRNDSIDLGSATLPELSNISVSLSFDGFGSNAGQQKTWAIVTDAGKLVGLQMTDDGMIAWTGWTGTEAMNQYSDLGAYTNSATLAAEFPTGNFTVDFVVDTANKAITVSYGDTSVSLTYSIDATEVTGLATGLYRYYGAMNTYEISITEPDATYMILSGDTAFAKVSGQTVTREYTRTESVITPDETFTWTISPEADGISVADGVVSVTDAATPGEYVLTATGTTEKTASITITVADYSELTATVDGPTAYTVGQTGTYSVTSLVDAYDDDVIDLFTPSYASSNENVITIDAATGVAEAVGNGTATITITVGNPGIEAVETIDVTVDVYYVTAEATGDSTVVNIESIYDKADSFLVTTSKDGVLVNQIVVSADDVEYEGGEAFYSADATVYEAYYNEDGSLKSLKMTSVKGGDTVIESDADKVFEWDDNMVPVPYGGGVATIVITVDTTGADMVEIAPIYTTTIGTVMEVPADTYNVTATVNNGSRTDLYVNGQMLMNNINQGSDNWTVGRTLAETAEYEANDIVIAEGYANFNLQDDKSSGTTVTGITFVKAPSIVDRAQRIYVIGDSLTAKYYGDAAEGQEGLVRTGWGDVLANYVAEGVEVTNLGNSGAWAAGMLADAFTNVAASAKAGDIVVWESGYNDRSYSTVDEMKASITEAANVCADMGVDFYVVTPNASRHDYSSSVVWSSYIRELAEEQNMKLIDLCADSFELLSGLYGTDADTANEVLITYYNNSGDTLHSSYNAANLWAAIVAQGLYDAGLTDVVNTTYSYTFNDGTQDVTAQVTAE